MNYIKDKWPMLISLFFCGALLWYAFGCEPKTQSLIDPARKVTRAALEIEYSTLLAMHQQRTADLKKKDEIRNFILQQSITVAETGSINPVGVLTSLLAIFGIGATADDYRLRKKLKKSVLYEPVADSEK